MPGFSIAKLRELSRLIPLAVVNLTADVASSNTRVKLFVADECVKHNEKIAEEGRTSGFVLLLDSKCFGHILHTIVERVFGTARLIPCLHSVAYSCEPPSNLKAIARELRKVVQEDFATNFFPRSPPPPSSKCNRPRICCA